MPKILLADDEPAIRLLVSATLSAAGCELLEAEDGSVALAKARADLPDLVILDWTMPCLSGLEVARALREDPLTAGIPVILLTARQLDDDRALSSGVHAYAHLTKPFSPLELLESVYGALQR